MCRVQNEGEFFSLTGRLDAPWTGSVGHVSAARTEEHRKKKKRKADAELRYVCSAIQRLQCASNQLGCRALSG